MNKPTHYYELQPYICDLCGKLIKSPHDHVQPDTPDIDEIFDKYGQTVGYGDYYKTELLAELKAALNSYYLQLALEAVEDSACINCNDAPKTREALVSAFKEKIKNA